MTIIVPASAVEIPARQTLAEMRGEVLGYVVANPDAENIAAANSAINHGVSKLNRHMWDKHRGYVDYTLETDKWDYRLPRNFLNVSHAQLLDSNGNPNKQLVYLDEKDFEIEFQRVTAAGTSSCYTVYFGTRYLTLERAPTTAIVSDTPTLRVRYFVRFDKLRSANSVLRGGSPEMDEYLYWNGCVEMAAIRDRSKIAYAEGRRREVLNDLLDLDPLILEDI